MAKVMADDQSAEGGVSRMFPVAPTGVDPVTSRFSVVRKATI